MAHMFPFAKAAMLAVLIAVGACSKGADDPAGQSGGWSLPAGSYSDRTAGSDVDPRGFLLELPAGDRSRTAFLTRCAETCGPRHEAALMRGLNGVSFSVSEAGRAFDVTVTPAAADAVLLSADWGAGLEAVRLKVVTP